MMTPEDLKTYESLEKIAGETAAETNYEAVAQAKPDLIVIGVPKPALGDIDLDRLKSIAPVVAIGPTTPDAWRDLSRLDGGGRAGLRTLSAQTRRSAETVAGQRPGRVHAGFSGKRRPASPSLAVTTLP